VVRAITETTVQRVKRHHRSLRLVLALAVCALGTLDARACAIPVFRFALERWASDLYEVDVFYRGELTPSQRAELSAIEDLSSINGGRVNLEVVRCRVDGDLAADLAEVWSTIGEVPLPHVVLRAPGGRQGSPQVWSGSLAEFAPTLTDSPARQELVRRLLAGDSVVWLVLPGTDADAARALTQQLETALSALAEEIAIPNGVGLPGSELVASIPLKVSFSVLTAKADEERSLRAQVAAHLSDDAEASETLVVPVFGRGRALQTLQAGEVDDEAIAEISRFLCGACSCQVKQLNPGFDLLLSVSWDERLFAPGEPVPTETPPTSDPAAPPEYVAIPLGSAPNAADQSSSPAATASSTASAPAQSDSLGIYLLAAAVLAVGLAAILPYFRTPSS
jgi:hypothetical protein